MAMWCGGKVGDKSRGKSHGLYTAKAGAPWGVPPQDCGPWALHSLPNSRKMQNTYLQLWTNFLKVSQEVKMRGLTNSNLEYKGTDHSVYWRSSVFLRFMNIFKRSPIESHETFC